MGKVDLGVEVGIMYIVARDFGHDWFKRNPQVSRDELEDKLFRKIIENKRWERYTAVARTQAELAASRVLKMAKYQ